MGNWAVLKINGKQYLVEEGQTLTVDNLAGAKDQKSVNFKDVLLIKSGNGLNIGKPFVDKAQVAAQVVGDLKGKKVRVVKFKSKSRYLRTTGHRQKHTKIKIDKISSK
jgi:large subunit ribosomal protein L21